MSKEASQKNIITRLRTLKGHISGIERMVEENKNCDEILVQIAAIKSSIHKIGTIIVEEHALDCLLNQENGEAMNKEQVEKVIKTLISYMK